ncbi:UBX domain-containing protein 2A [Varanus komodoensis]|uniref:UBX domain-containing protein 2A n=1 Tax=Varanus komodoensis TaxID=61221 RepID=A0A8D2L2C6_VARKO|nr:UBX domain-containing protein 2A [Varanus komodoensis]XP_044301090.1 UBX domain-containing protein 2A [Varanus komodoensis]
MQEVDNVETLKQEWICKPNPDGQIQKSTEQNDGDIFVDSLFEEVQKVGAECTQQTTVKNKADTTIKLWKNGFTVNDGELRSYKDTANQRFLDSIKKGELPLELQKICDKEEVDVKVDDKKDVEYTLRKPAFHPFSGQGYRLGSATPRIISKVERDVEETEKRKPTVVLNNSEPITRVQIWFADGTRIVQKFNISHRISHVRDFITNYDRQQGRSPFMLTTSLPFRELLNESLTLEQANLKNAVVVQRLKKDTEPFRNLT